MNQEEIDYINSHHSAIIKNSLKDANKESDPNYLTYQKNYCSGVIIQCDCCINNRHQMKCFYITKCERTNTLQEYTDGTLTIPCLE